MTFIQKILILALTGSLLVACTSTPTGRKQLMLYPEASELEIGRQAFADAEAEDGLSSNARYRTIVERVGKRIADVSRREDYAWGLFAVLLPPIAYIYGLFRMDKAGQSLLVAVAGLFMLFLAF